MIKKTFLIFITLLAVLIIQTGFAEENSPAIPVYVNIDHETKPVFFGSDKTAKVDVHPDHTNKTVQLNLPPGSAADIMLPSCNNQHVTANQSVTCTFSSSSPVQMTLVDFSHWTSTQKGALLGGIAGCVLMISGLTDLGVALLPAETISIVLLYGVLGAATGAAIGAAT